MARALDFEIHQDRWKYLGFIQSDRANIKVILVPWVVSVVFYLPNTQCSLEQEGKGERGWGGGGGTKGSFYLCGEKSDR